MSTVCGSALQSDDASDGTRFASSGGVKPYSTLPVAFGVLFLLAAGGWAWLVGSPYGRFCWECALLQGHRHGRPPERNASASLKTIVSAQADYRANDRDGNGTPDYWRADIAGLYAVKPARADDAIKLIEISVAGADAAAVEDITLYTRKAPKAGYWYKALRHADEDPAKPDPNRFAACAYPDSPAAGKWAFIVSEDNTVYRRPWKSPADTPLLYPDLETLKRDWMKLD